MENAILMVENGQEKVSSGVERGVIMRLPIAQIDAFPKHPFKEYIPQGIDISIDLSETDS